MYSPSIRRAILRNCAVRSRSPAVCSRHQLRSRLLSTVPAGSPASVTEPAPGDAQAQEPGFDFEAQLAVGVSRPTYGSTRTLDSLVAEVEQERFAQIVQEQKPEHEMNVDPRISRRAILHISGAKDLPTVLSALQETEKKYGRIRDYWITVVRPANS